SRLEKIEELRVHNKRLQGLEQFLDRLFLKLLPGHSGEEAEEIHDLVLSVREPIDENAHKLHPRLLNVVGRPEPRDIGEERFAADRSHHADEREEVLRLQRRLLSHDTPPQNSNGSPKGPPLRCVSARIRLPRRYSRRIARPTALLRRADS